MSLQNVAPKDVSAQIDRKLREVTLDAGGAGDNPVNSYSGGMQRRLSVALATVGSPSPKLLLLDEVRSLAHIHTHTPTRFQHGGLM